MKICLVAEGCYPYVVGGVSGWMQMMIKGLAEHDFEIFTIAVDESQRGQFQYELPQNVGKVWENFLITEKIRPRRGALHLTKRQAEGLQKLIRSDADIPWKEVYFAIRSRGFDADAYMAGHDFFDAAQARYERDGIREPFSDYLWTLRSMYRPLFTILSNEIPQADLYQSVSAGYAGVIGALGALIHGKPFILAEHGIYTREREEELIRSEWTKGYFKEMWIKQFYSLSQFAYERADAVVSLFEKNAEVQAELGCPREKIRIIPNGVSTVDYADVKWRRESDGAVNIGAVVRVTPIKDIKTMIASFHVVKQAVPEAKFFILGPYEEDPDYYQECLNLIAQLGLEDVEMPGRVSIRDYLPRMDIMVMTSISEGQPLAILEGMMFHKPWVSTNVGSCGELLQGRDGDMLGAAGLVVPVMDTEQISSAILTLIRDEKQRLAMGEAGYQRAQTHYRLDTMFERYRNLYDELTRQTSD